MSNNPTLSSSNVNCDYGQRELPRIANILDLEVYAKAKLSPMAYDYYASGAMDERTLARNKSAYSNILLKQRILTDASHQDTTVQLLQKKAALPIGISPTAFHCLAHVEGEKATAKAAAEFGVCHTMSSWSTISMEEVAASIADIPNAAVAPRWFQLYVYKERHVTEQLIRRAEAAGFDALVITVDLPVAGIRYHDIRNRFVLHPPLCMANFDGLAEESNMDKLQSTQGKSTSLPEQSALATHAARFLNSSLTWEDFKWLASFTRLPVILKGIMCAEDARLAKDFGSDLVKAVWVSNHGGRQLDSAPSTIEVLPEVVKELANSNIEVYLDGGIRNGADVFKALALGAKAVFVGRPILYGLAYDGQEGVKLALQILNDELRNVMALAGCHSLADIGTHCLHKFNPFCE